MKFCQVHASTALVLECNNELQAKAYHTAHTNWCRIFNGVVHRAFDPRFDPNEFDVVHIQVSGDTLDAVWEIRKRITGNTKLVVNPDYSVDHWKKYGHNYGTVFETLRQADYIFGQCMATGEFLADQMPGTDIHYCPHPIDTTWLGNHAKNFKDRSREDVVVNIHRDAQGFGPFWVLRAAKIDRILISHVVGLDAPKEDLTHKVFDHIHKWMSNPKLIDLLLRNAFCVIDHYSHRVQGRSAMEAAALGVPYLGFSTGEAAAKCFPELTVEAGDMRGQRERLELLAEDDELVIEYGVNAKVRCAEFYGFETCERRFLEMVKWDE